MCLYFAVMVDDRKRKVGLLEEQNGRQARSLRIVGDNSSGQHSGVRNAGARHVL